MTKMAQLSVGKWTTEAIPLTAAWFVGGYEMASLVSRFFRPGSLLK